MNPSDHSGGPLQTITKRDHTPQEEAVGGTKSLEVAEEGGEQLERRWFLLDVGGCW